MKKLCLTLVFMLVTVSAYAMPIFPAITGSMSKVIPTNTAQYGICVQATLNNYSGYVRTDGSIDGVNYVRLGCYSGVNVSGTSVTCAPVGSTYTYVKVTHKYNYHGTVRSGRQGTAKSDVNWR